MEPRLQSDEAPERTRARRPKFLAVLGVLWPCTVADVKQAYLERAKHLHPDKGGSPAEFAALQHAFEQSLQYAEFHSGRTRWLAGTVERYLLLEQFCTQLRQRGARLEVESVAWLRDEIGEDFAQLLESISVIAWNGLAVDDASLRWLTNDPSLLVAMHWLDLSDSGITDDGLACLTCLPSLRRLDLHRTSVTARGLAVIDKLPNLISVGLMGVPLGWLAKRRLRRRHPLLTLLTPNDS